MSVQIIAKEGQPEWAVIPYEMYLKLVADAEMLADVQAYDEAKQALTADGELIPAAVAYALLDGENPLKVWREYRGFTQHQLAVQAGLSAAYLSQIESGKRKGTAEVWQHLAHALGVSIDDVWEEPAH